ncbi:uncharacterized protein [Vicugna pacos]|uniref:Uncharacterized protein n=1 Tax=Vicugna pacos TaxID=30538 RepID=A0ABM5BGV0_VICPA
MSFCLRPVLEAQLVFIGPPLAPSSVLLPAPVGKQIAPPPNTGSDAALLCCGQAGHCPSGCRSQMLQTGQAGGRVVPSPSTSVRGCVPARQAGGRSPPACAAGSSAALCGCALCAGAPPWLALRPGRAPRVGSGKTEGQPRPCSEPRPSCLFVFVEQVLWGTRMEGSYLPRAVGPSQSGLEAAKPFGADTGFASGPAWVLSAGEYGGSAWAPPLFP